MTYKEVLEEIREQCDSVRELAYEGLEGEEAYPNAQYDNEQYNIYKNSTLGLYKRVLQYGGEGKGDEWYVVYHFIDHDIYIRIDGYYQSYSGTEFNGWDSCREVRPQEKTIIVYE